jgi:integrase
VAPDWLLRILMVLRYTGMRRGAVVALSWADLDLDKNRLVVRPETTKGGHGGRVVPLIGPLRAYLDGLERIGPLVVAPPATGTHVGRQVRRLWRATGAPEEVWVGQPTKAFRKAVRTGLAVAGVQDRVIDRLLGHGPGSVGAAHYLDSRALDPQLAEAMAHVPEIGGEA